jgi:hypothetical protein
MPHCELYLETSGGGFELLVTSQIAVIVYMHDVKTEETV